MKNVLIFLVMGCCLISTAFANYPNIEAGMQKAQACAACHGPDGNSTQPIMPNLAEQNTKYFIMQMDDFKQGAASGRDNAIMHSIASGLSEQDIVDLAHYFAKQKVKIGAVEPKYLQQGRRIYMGGNLKQHLPACTACHGPRGRGNEQAGFPMLAGQHVDYIVQQLQAYKSGTRKNDLNMMMRTIASKLTPEEMQAVASYINGLH